MGRLLKMPSTFGHRLVWCLVLVIAFYISGCIIFVNLERDAELMTYKKNRDLYENMQKLYSFEHCEDPAFQKLGFCKNQAKFTESLKVYFNQHGNSIVDKEQWTVLGTLFFLTHLSTTIGYGNSHVQTPAGQLATIVFAIIGIPIMGYTLAQVARLNLQASVIMLEHCGSMKIRTPRSCFMVLWCWLLSLLFIGAFVYSKLEPWTYLQSLYFCFMTLSTVGFGDFLPSSPTSRVFSIFYIIFGLGMCASIIAMLTGLVAEGHQGVDELVLQKMSSCSECCNECTQRQ